MVEANYENEQDPFTDGGSTRNLRRQEYWTLLRGATGQLYGSGFTDRIANGWSAANLDSVGVTQLGYATSLFASLPWYSLVPDQSHTLVTAGFGTFASTGSIESEHLRDRPPWRPMGARAMTYMPTARTITVDMSKLADPNVPAMVRPNEWHLQPPSVAPRSRIQARSSSRLLRPTAAATATGYWF